VYGLKRPKRTFERRTVDYIGNSQKVRFFQGGDSCTLTKDEEKRIMRRVFGDNYPGGKKDC
jgi:hypothetical protein